MKIRFPHAKLHINIGIFNTKTPCMSQLYLHQMIKCLFKSEVS